MKESWKVVLRYYYAIRMQLNQYFSPLSPFKTSALVFQQHHLNQSFIPPHLLTSHLPVWLEIRFRTVFFFLSLDLYFVGKAPGEGFSWLQMCRDWVWVAWNWIRRLSFTSKDENFDKTSSKVDTFGRALSPGRGHRAPSLRPAGRLGTPCR